jgi:hypothetical protein
VRGYWAGTSHREGDGCRAVRRGPNDVPALHRLSRELEGGVAEVKAIGLPRLALAGEEGGRETAGDGARLIDRRGREDAAGSVGEGVGGARREAEDVDDDDDTGLAPFGEEVDA